MRRILSFTRVRFGAALFAGAALFLSASFSSAQSKPPAKQEPKKSTSTKSSTPAKKRTPARSSSRSRGQAAPTPERIQEIQQALIVSGHLKGEPTKKWDAATVGALKAFQSASDLNPTGKLDARTLQKLGLGSEVAGIAPPRPSATSAEEPRR